MNTRNARIIMDYAAGAAVATLAEREHVSPQRVSQLLNKVAHQLFGVWGATYMLQHYPDRVAARLAAARTPSSFDIATPEGHYWEVVNEPRTFESLKRRLA